jgi:glycosyltransferase involved in cell wall biosynthesis
VVDSSDPDAFPAEVARLSSADGEVPARALDARRYAERHFTQKSFVEQFERVLKEVVVR